MAYNNIVDVSIAIQSATVSQQGFGTPIFLCAHGFTDERVIEVSSVDELINGYGFPEDHAAIWAATQYFRNTPSINTFKVGRVAGTIPVIVNLVDEALTTFTISIQDVGGNNLYNGTASVNGRDDTSIIAATELAQSLNADGASALFNISAIGSQVQVTSIDSEVAFRIVAAVNGTESTITIANYVDLENGGTALAAIRDVDDDFYFVTCEPRCYSATGQSFCQQVAAYVETVDKMFFTSSNSMDDLNHDPTSFFYFTSKDGSNLTKTVLLYHQNAEGITAIDSFPECYYSGYNAPFDAGSVSWSNLNVALAPSQQPNGRLLTTTQKVNIANNANANFVERDSGLNILRTGQTASGEWIDVLRGVHWLTADMTTSLKALLFSQKGGKVPYTNQGIARVREVIQSSLQRGVNRGFIDSYQLTVPFVSNVSNVDWVNRVLRGIKFTGILSGAIHTVSISGSVTSPSN